MTRNAPATTIDDMGQISKVLIITMTSCGLLLGLSCKSKKAGCHAVSVGSCDDAGKSGPKVPCNIEVACGDDSFASRELRCTPPDTQLPMKCECIEAGVKKKDATITTALPHDLGGAMKMATSACGWSAEQ